MCAERLLPFPMFVCSLAVQDQVDIQVVGARPGGLGPDGIEATGVPVVVDW
jgi:hypothetical protein